MFSSAFHMNYFSNLTFCSIKNAEQNKNYPKVTLVLKGYSELVYHSAGNAIATACACQVVIRMYTIAV